jgi:hypothetical protein
VSPYTEPAPQTNLQKVTLGENDPGGKKAGVGRPAKGTGPRDMVEPG